MAANIILEITNADVHNTLDRIFDVGAYIIYYGFFVVVGFYILRFFYRLFRGRNPFRSSPTTHSKGESKSYRHMDFGDEVGIIIKGTCYCNGTYIINERFVCSRQASKKYIPLKSRKEAKRAWIVANVPGADVENHSFTLNVEIKEL
ncbi:MAG: hypothetical protein IJ190_12235 [Prevotella sp.]|nr:hypothetical protein [Prevotella sp.]